MGGKYRLSAHVAQNKERVFTLSYHLNNEPQTNDQYLYYKDIDDARGIGNREELHAL